MPKNTFSNTRVALAEFDAGKEFRNSLWAGAETTDDVAAAELIDQEALIKAQTAFHEDTKDINSREHCRRVDIAFMRQCVAGADK